MQKKIAQMVSMFGNVNTPLNDDSLSTDIEGRANNFKRILSTFRLLEIV